MATKGLRRDAGLSETVRIRKDLSDRWTEALPPTQSVTWSLVSDRSPLSHGDLRPEREGNDEDLPQSMTVV